MSLILICECSKTLPIFRGFARPSLIYGLFCILGGMKKPVVRIARMGGQYAKPRSKPTEMHEGKEINSFRYVSFEPDRKFHFSNNRYLTTSGDIINGFSVDDRMPDPERLLEAYHYSSATVNYARSLLASGFASLPTSHEESVPWSLPLEHVRSPELLKSYEEIVKNLSEALEFMRVVGAEKAKNGGLSGGLESADIWMSHEVS